MTRTFGTILENVVLDERGVVDLDDCSKTENTRAAYKLEQIANALPAKRAGHPQAVVFLTADAFGILPPIARLTRDQAMYWFLSGFTAKLAGTEIGVKEPQPTFSAVLRRAVPAAAPGRLRAAAREEARRARREGLAREHGLDRRHVRRGRADADRRRRGRCFAPRSPASSRTPSTGRTSCSASRCPSRCPMSTRSCSTPALRGATPRRTTRRRASSRRCSATTSPSSTPTRTSSPAARASSALAAAPSSRR